jgi:hypothetical protein
MEKFTIHIFGYGETQVISAELSKKINSSSLTKVKPLVDAIWAKKPKDSKAEEKYHAINFFGHGRVIWVSNDGFELIDEEAIYPLIDDLILEMQNYVEETATETATTTV